MSLMDTNCAFDRPRSSACGWIGANERSAYRCLPLNIANAHGWEILCTTSFSAIWDGRPSVDAIRIKTKPGTVALAISHFGEAAS